MFVGIGRLDLLIPSAFSLKDKRKVIKSLKDSVFSRTGIRITELDGGEKWNFGSVGFAVVGGSETDTKRFVEEIIRIFDENDEVQIVNKGVDYFKYE